MEVRQEIPAGLHSEELHHTLKKLQMDVQDVLLEADREHKLPGAEIWRDIRNIEAGVMLTVNFDSHFYVILRGAKLPLDDWRRLVEYVDKRLFEKLWYAVFFAVEQEGVIYHVS